MSPEFEEMVGDDLDAAERRRLERVHDLLVAVGPPPEYVAPEPVQLRPRRRQGALIALAAAFAVTVLALGAALVQGSDGPDVGPIAMEGTAAASGASASLTIYDLDEAGNWPMKVTVEGLAPAPRGRPYELWLTRGGKLEALCGSFLTDEQGFASIPMNAPYRFSDFDGWVVVEEGSEAPVLTT
jgi:hypothetical protein